MKRIYIIRGNDNMERKKLAEAIIKEKAKEHQNGLVYFKPKRKDIENIINAFYMNCEIVLNDSFQNYLEFDTYVKLATLSSYEIVIFRVGDKDFCEKIPKGTRVVHGNPKRYLRGIV